MKKTVLFLSAVVCCLGIVRADDGAQAKDKVDKEVRIRAIVTDKDGKDARVKVLSVDEKGKPITLTADDITVMASGDITATAKSGGGWLGVHVGSVPSAVAAHLGIEKGSGVIVLNIVDGSPADKAGIEKHDVIVSMNGKPVGSNLSEFVDSLRKHKKGAEVKFGIIHHGKKKTIALILGEAQPAKSARYKFDVDEDGFLDDAIKIRRHVLRKGPKGWIGSLKGPGKWEWKLDVDDEGKIILDSGGQVELNIQKTTKDGKKTTKIRQVTDGTSVEIEQTSGDGERIIVTRKTKKKNGAEIVKKAEYKNSEELKKADPDAYKLYRKSKSDENRVRVFGKNIDIDIPKIDIDIDKHAGDLGRIIKDIELEPRIRDLLKAHKLDAERLKDVAEVARQKIIESWEPDWQSKDKVDRKFEVDKEGWIKVTIKKGGSSVETTFKNEEEMKKKEPKLYEHYKKLLSE